MRDKNELWPILMQAKGEFLQARAEAESTQRPLPPSPSTEQLIESLAGMIGALREKIAYQQTYIDVLSEYVGFASFGPDAPPDTPSLRLVRDDDQP